MVRCEAGFSVKEHYQNRNRLERPTEEKSDAEWRYGLDEIDFSTVHRLLTNETENLQNFGHLNRLRPQVVVVNTERGGVIEEEALADLIQVGKLAWVSLDVYANETKIHS